MNIGKDVEVALALELPKSKDQFMKMNTKESPTNKANADPKIPKVSIFVCYLNCLVNTVSLQGFLCAINGHVMKDPVRVKSTGLVFERETIELWLATRGAVCPITNTLLEKSDLENADDLRME